MNAILAPPREHILLPYQARWYALNGDRNSISRKDGRMTDITKNASRLGRLADALVDDLMSVSDEELLAEIRADGLDAQKLNAQASLLIERARRSPPPGG